MAAPIMLANWTQAFTEWQFLGNRLWQWAALLGVLIVSFAAGKIISFILEHQAERFKEAGKLTLFATFLKSLSGPVTMLALAIGLYAAAGFMDLTYEQQDGQSLDLMPFWLKVCTTITVLAVGWFLYRMVDLLEFFLHRWTSRTDSKLDDQLVPVLRKSLRVFVVIIVLLFIAQNIFDQNIGALIAGLGIGGLAFALAAKDMLSNFFGSVTIFADRPFQLGDWVRIADYEGVIEEVGFRSTRIRTFYGHLVTIPNATVANTPVDNVARRPFIRRNLNVTVTYDTPPEKLQKGMDILRDMLDARNDHWPADRPGKVCFSDYNAASLNILVVYWFTPPDWWEYQAFNNDFNMELLERFNAEGIEFAFPTQTLYLKQDSALVADLNVSGQPRLES